MLKKAKIMYEEIFKEYYEQQKQTKMTENENAIATTEAQIKERKKQLVKAKYEVNELMWKIEDLRKELEILKQAESLPLWNEKDTNNGEATAKTSMRKQEK